MKSQRRKKKRRRANQSMSGNFGSLLGLAVKHHPHDRDSEPHHSHNRHRIPENQNRNHRRHRGFGIPQHLKRQRAGVLRHQKVGQVDQISDRGIPKKQEQNKRVSLGFLHSESEHIPFDVESKRQEYESRQGSHVEKQVHGVKLLPFRGQENPLNHRLQSATSS